jgi:hypothetical protein
MATNDIYIPVLCPVKFVRKNYTNPAGYNTRYFEDWNFTDTIRNFEEQVGHLDPWQNSDTVQICLLSNYAPFTLIFETCEGVQAGAAIIPRVVASTDASGMFFYWLPFSLAGYAEGVYRFRILCGDPQADELVSEWMHVAPLHENSGLLEYSHDENDHDVPFETGIAFSKRLIGGLTQYAPKTDRVLFIDQPRNAVQLDAKSFSTERLYFNGPEGLPPWSIERFNAAFLCSTVLFDGVQYTANDNAQMEPTRETDYPLTGWTIEVRRAKSKLTKRFSVDTLALGEPTTTLVYTVEGRGLGSDVPPGASVNDIKIIATE